MKWRLREGQGEAIYDIGVSDNGALTGLNEDDMDESLSTLRYSCFVYKNFAIVYD